MNVCAGPESATAADDLPMPLEYLAIHKELALAYRLLEANSGLKVTCHATRSCQCCYCLSAHVRWQQLSPTEN